MKFIKFAQYLEKLESLSSRNELTQVLAEAMRELEPNELKEAIYLMQGRICPAYIPVEFSFSVKSVVNIIAEIATNHGISDYSPLQRFKVLGDAGLVAAEFVADLRERDGKKDAVQQAFDLENPTNFDLSTDYAELSVLEIFTQLQDLAKSNGAGTVARKSEIIKKLFLQVSPIEAKYLSRIVVGQLRLGVSGKTVLDAISWAVLGNKSLRAHLDRALGIRSDMGYIAELAITAWRKHENGSPEEIAAAVKESLEDLKLQVGTPVAAQLVEREKDAESIVARIPQALTQTKYDGLRAQVHYSKNGFDDMGIATHESEKMRIFSRNMEPLTSMFPDIEKLMVAQDFDSIVLDGEIIGYDESTETFMPFQETIKRKRKHDVEAASEGIPIRYYVFDILFYNGEDLTTRPLSERYKLLQNIVFKENKNKLFVTESPIFTGAGELEKYFRARLDEGYEGVIVKAPESFYQPGKRGYDWIKLKANTFSDLKDTVDGVVMGYYAGRGHRAKYGIGGFLVGVYNEEQGVYQTIAKVGSGIKEEEWAKYKDQLDTLKLEIMPKDYQIHSELMPDVIVSPKIVIEVDADEITLSKMHTAGKKEFKEGSTANSSSESGYSLRFPRLKIFGRDKGPEQTTSIQELQGLLKLSK